MVVLILALGVYINRARMERVVIATSIYRAHIFTPPQPIPEESRWHRFRDATQFYWDFSEIPVARERRLKLLNPTLQPLVKEINRRQAAGEDMNYSVHIYREIRWWLNFTPDIATTRARIADLRQSLSQPMEQWPPAGQQASDGSWGRGLAVWYLRLYYSVDDVLQCKAPPKYPLSFLDRVNSPEKLDAQLDSDLHNDFTKTGVFNREELDETFSAMARLLFGTTQTGCYKFHPELRNALKEFVARWQNPATGCWGQWVVDRQGRVWKMDDMGMTFHVISDLHGQVQHKDKIARRLLQLDNVNFPAGIRFNGHYENHLNWDAVKIFRSAWPTLDEPTRQQVRAEIFRMLDWCLKNSYQSDGSFKVSDLDDTEGDAYRYGVDFLQETGYFQRENRFWTDQDFPDANAVRDRIETKLKSTGLNDPGLKEAYETLRATEIRVH
ncbi:MAG TPA: hypothetical protein VHX63_08475 [Acidobacteriaceae bacterium]|jgi:hypothetical protein|nr:hypothetical protein [Acidobacteriaceae bacterium]